MDTLVMNIGDLGICRISGAAKAETEEIPITDPRLMATWKHNIVRTLVTFEGRTIRLEVTGSL